MQAILIAALLSLMAMPALAQNGEPERYQLISVSGGFVRLNTVSGVMTFCRDEVDSFRCGPISTESAENQVKPEMRGKPEDSELRKRGFREDSSTQDFDRALSMMERAMRSFMAITQEKPRECAL